MSVNLSMHLALIVGLALLFVLPEPGERRRSDGYTDGAGETMSQEAKPTERPDKG